MTRAVLVLAALVFLASLIPALIDGSEPDKFGSGSRAKEHVPFVASPSPGEHRLVGLNFELVRATRSKQTVRHKATRRPVVAAGAIPDLIRSVFARFGSAVAERAVTVFGCESGFNPSATNGQHAGLAQLSRRYQEARARRLGFTWAQMFEPLPNLTVAADLFAEQGWGPWTCAR